MTLSEQRLTRIWGRAQTNGNWWECWQTLAEIHQAFVAAEIEQHKCELWRDASIQALARITFDIREREAA
jgi:hypothetical protein